MSRPAGWAALLLGLAGLAALVASLATWLPRPRVVAETEARGIDATPLFWSDLEEMPLLEDMLRGRRGANGE